MSEDFRTDHMNNQAKIMYQKLWEAVKILHIFTPYTYSSEYYAHKGAAEQLAKALPEREKKEFLDFINEKIKGMSNYSGD